MQAARSTHRRARISVKEAESIILAHARPWPSAVCKIDVAGGRVLREDLIADRDFPPFDRVTMDGIAIKYDAFEVGRRKFHVQGIQAAGAPRLSLSDSDSCFEVMTGAVLPAGTDCVIRVEDVDRDGDDAVIHADAGAVPLQYVHRQGSDYKSGDVLVRAGNSINPPLLAVCASIGKLTIRVAAEPIISVVATGNELVSVSVKPEPHQIRMTNPYAVRATLQARGYQQVDIHHVSDDRIVMVERLKLALAQSDVLVISGGVSAGKFDLVPSVLKQLGVEELFHRVLQRPGLPLWFGVSADEKVVFALPGNPVSALVSTVRYVVPFLDLCGKDYVAPPQKVVLSEDYEFEPELTLFLPVVIKRGEDDRMYARPRPVNGSGDFAHLAESDGFIELPAAMSRFAAGSVWPLYRWGCA